MHDRRGENREEFIEVNRRGFLEAGAGILAAAAVLGACPRILVHGIRPTDRSVQAQLTREQ